MDRKHEKKEPTLDFHKVAVMAVVASYARPENREWVMRELMATDMRLRDMG